MRPPTRRPPKRGPPPDVYPSPASVEFISVTSDNGRVTKKRVIEKAKVDLRLFNDPALNIDIASLPANPTPPQTTGEDSAGKETNTASRSVSVSMLFHCHVTVGSYPTDQAL